MRWGLVARNVCDAVSPTRPAKREIQPLTREQAQQLLEAARGHRLEVFLILALVTGARRGELVGLRWRGVRFEDGSIQIRRTVSRITGYGLVESEPKTAKGRRKIILPQLAVDALKQHRTHQAEDRLRDGAAWNDFGLVFCTQHGNLLDPNQIPLKFYKLLAEVGLPRIRFHDLRHSAATFLLSMGVHPKIVQEILGHSAISITIDIYSLSLPSMQEEAMEKLNELFRKPS
jgi:integrase